MGGGEGKAGARSARSAARFTSICASSHAAPFDEVFKAIGISAIATPVRSPKANAFAERWVRTVREDWLDHLLIYSRRHLESVLGFYVRHYNESRPHRGRQLAPPLPRHDQPHTGQIYRRDILDGIIHEYDRAA